MKKIAGLLIIIGVVCLCSSNVYSQTIGSGFGIKGGLNYNTSGKYFQDAESIWKNPGASMGYHAGVFYKLEALGLFLRPELVYTETKFDSGFGRVKTQRLDAPVLAGLHILRIASIMAGPSFHYTLDDNFTNRNDPDFNSRFRVGYQFGLGLNLGPIGLDLRYERELNDQRISWERIQQSGNNFKSEQVILGLSLQF